MIVVDTNIIGYLYLSSDRSELVEQVLLTDDRWVSPLLWRSEFRNVLAHYIRKGLLSFEDAVQIMNEAMSLMDGMEYEVNSLDVLRLVKKSSCSAYDCEFVALARTLGIVLVTVDRQILREFPLDAVSPEDFLNARRICG